MKLLTFVVIVIIGAATSVAARQARFRAGVDVVMLNVGVTDGKRNITDLTAADFEVLDSGVSQEVLSAVRERWPIDLTVLMQTSQAMTWWSDEIVLNAVERLRKRLRPEDRMAFVTFNERIRERLPLGPAEAAARLDAGKRDGETSLYDALATVYAMRPVPDRRQMVLVFVDLFDNTSVLDEGDVLEMAKRSHTATFIVSRLTNTAYWSGPETPPTTRLLATPRVPARHPLGFFYRAAAVTGGAVHPVPATTIVSGGNWIRMSANRNLLDEPFIRTMDDFRASYVLHYSLTGVPRAGWHEVTVKVKRPGSQNYRIRARNGYVGG
jgi:VWFA-related protein